MNFYFYVVYFFPTFLINLLGLFFQMDFDIPNSTFDNIHFVKEVGSYFFSILSTNYVVFQTGQFFRLKRMHHIAPSLFDFAAMQSSLAATDKWICIRDIGICRCLNLIQTHKCSLWIMRQHIFQTKLC